MIPTIARSEATRGNTFLCQKQEKKNFCHHMFVVWIESLTYVYMYYRRDSYTYEKWMNKLSSSGWLSHVKDILTCGCLVAQCIERVRSIILLNFQYL